MLERIKVLGEDLSFFDVREQRLLEVSNPSSILETMFAEQIPFSVMLHELWRTERPNDMYEVVQVLRTRIGKSSKMPVNNITSGMSMVETTASMLQSGESGSRCREFLTDTISTVEKAMRKLPFDHDLGKKENDEIAENITSILFRANAIRNGSNFLEN